MSEVTIGKQWLVAQLAVETEAKHKIEGAIAVLTSQLKEIDDAERRAAAERQAAEQPPEVQKPADPAERAADTAALSAEVAAGLARLNGTSEPDCD